MIPRDLQPWPVITQSLEEKYQVLNWYVISMHDFNFQSMTKFWDQYKNHVFGPNERIIVVDTETQYYAEKNSIGHGLFNLFLTLHHYNIPSDFVILLTNYPAQKEVSELCRLFNLPRPVIHQSDYFLGWIQPDIANAPNNFDNIQKVYICLNGQSRAHRVDVLCLLKDYNLIDRGIVTYNFSKNKSLPQTTLFDTTNKLGFRTTIPWSRLNELYPKNKKLSLAFERHGSSIVGCDFSNADINNYHAREYVNVAYYNFVQSAAVCFINETAMEYPYPYITEKTWQAIMHSRPFVITGPKGTLKKLHSLGFQTFNDYWDESYDGIEDTADRICAAVDVIKKICDLPLLQLVEMVKQMSDVLEHNTDVYQEKFSKIDLQTLLNQL